MVMSDLSMYSRTNRRAKASPHVEAAQTDAAIPHILVQQKSTNKKAADGEEDVDSDVPVR
jgi:hypothetical protein